MNREKLKLIVFLAGTALSSGCAMDGARIPFRDSIAAGWNKVAPGTSDAGDSGKLSSEFREAQKVFKKDPERTLLAWARWQEDVGEFGEARRKYRELLVAYPDNIEAQLGLARIELSCGRVQQAEEILTKLAKERPENTPVRLELGRLYTQQEDWPKAISAFEDASAIDPENQVCRYELGVAFARSHRFDQALSHLTYAVGGSAAHYNIGYILHEQGNDTEAVEWFQNALQSHPDPQTAEKTRMMLTQLSPNEFRDRNARPAYPPANPGGQAIASREKSSAIDRYEPKSFENPAIVAATKGTARISTPIQVVVAENVDGRSESSESSTWLPPVTPQPAPFSTAGQAILGNSEQSNPFRTVSHAVTHEQTAPAEQASGSLPQWRGASRPAPGPVTSTTGSPPSKWRGR
ncbi:MAG: tetratricopeptide repeat protein [Planctomycetaceae bacterium]|nr:tetratricopeptide repeat protein [Planctomycetaceae bacterium]